MIKRIAHQLLILSAFLFLSASIAQTGDTPIGDAKKFKINNIIVTGSETYNANTVIAFTGLKKGDQIFIPGERLSTVINKLWDLKLFSDIRVYTLNENGSLIDIELNIVEVPNLNAVTIDGLSKNKTKELKEELKLDKGRKATENLVTNTRSFIENKYREKGFLYADALVRTREVTDSTGGNMVDVKIEIDKGEKVKVKEITFEGNEELSDKKLRGAMSNTKRKNFFRILKRSKYIEDSYQEDLVSLVDAYKENGFRDARVVSDTLTKIDDKNVALNIKVEEGRKHYFGNIDFVGNTVYTDAQLRQKLKIEKGDVYNGVAFDDRISNPQDPDSDDLTNLYQNNGYLFSNVNAVETKVYNDTIDFEIRIVEGEEAFFNKITVSGNTRTNDHVIYRALRTNPGDKYSRQRIINSIRELGQLGFFDPQAIDPQLKNVNQQEGTVDVEYKLKETGASQIELQGGYGGGGFVGTLGLRFNNFSLRNLFKAKEYRPVPMGDGQTLAIRAQASSIFRTYSINFTEPWLGGKKPVSFNVSLSHSEQFRVQRNFRDVDRSQRFLITGGTVGIAKRLQWPDNFFQFSQAVSFQHYNLKNYQTPLFNFPNGSSNNFAYTVGLSRNNVGVNPIFPTYGSSFSLTAKVTPPYSVWNGVDYASLGDQEEFQTNGQPDEGKIDQERFKFLEYYKIKFEGTWYTQLYEKLILQTRTEFGFLGAYDNDRGLVPFERFFVGGDGLGAFSLDGRDIVRLRGYQDANAVTTNRDGDTVYNKFSFELRYPITLDQAASIYVLTFAEAGGSYDRFRNYNPFEVKRSAGLGLRIFMPAFGLLGVDFGYGFDTPVNAINNDPSGWNVHFIIGQQF